MSTHYDIRCVTCDKGAGFRVRGTDFLALLLKHIDTWKSLAGIVGFNTDVEIRCLWDDEGAAQRFPLFAAEHHSHKLAIRDEYGRYVRVEDCPYTFTCPWCERTTHCKLPGGHDGDHRCTALG